MPVTVVALIRPQQGRAQHVLDAFAEVTPLVHEEPGCELYAAHTDGDVVVMVERWTTQDDLDAHAKGAALQRLGGLLDGVLVSAPEVWGLEAVPFGDPVKGAIPAG
jgi:quinol monooxygenase YgiN